MAQNCSHFHEQKLNVVVVSNAAARHRTGDANCTRHIEENKYTRNVGVVGWAAKFQYRQQSAALCVAEEFEQQPLRRVMRYALGGTAIQTAQYLNHLGLIR